MSLSKSLRLCALTSFTTFSITTLVHGAQPAAAAPKIYNDKPISLAERIRVTKVMNDHADEMVANNIEAPVEFTWLPGYYIKSDTTRIAGAKALADCIKKHGLKLLVVPEKWAYKIPEKSLQAHTYKTRFVVAKKLRGTHKKTIPIDHVKQICTLIKNAKYDDLYYWDIKDSNLLSCYDGRTAFIDTEIMGFIAQEQQHHIIMNKLARNINNFDETAKALIQQELA